MSQRTRARTTVGATRKPSEERSTPSRSASKERGPTSEKAAFSSQALARTLRAVADELERDPELAMRISSSLASSESSVVPSLASPEEISPPAMPVAPRFRPRLITGTSPELGSGIPDPFALLAKRGEEGLHAALEDLRLGTLHAMIREHHLDPQGKHARQNDAAKLRKIILAAVIR